uniref:Uncharacterized protein n=1 Tax=Trichuris muris TaxID=70415 RepID=A0A5S6QF01_TRIMR
MNDHSSCPAFDTPRLVFKKKLHKKWNDVVNELRGVLESMANDPTIEGKGDAFFGSIGCNRFGGPPCFSPMKIIDTSVQTEDSCAPPWGVIPEHVALSPDCSTTKGKSPFYCMCSNEPRAPSKKKMDIQKRMEINSQTGTIEAHSPIVPRSCQVRWIEMRSPVFEDDNANQVSLTGDYVGRSRIRDDALKRLLQILHIEVLEGILRAKDRIDGLCSPRHNFLSSFLKLGREKQLKPSQYATDKATSSADFRHAYSHYQFNDKWMDLAIDCLGRLKTKVLLGISNQPDLPHARKYIYEQVKRFFVQLTTEEHLIPSEYVPIIIAITKLLFNENCQCNEQAIEATQLLLVLLRDDYREHLMQLLRFMQHVAAQQSEPLTQNNTNENIAIRDLLSIVVKAKADDQREVRFWLRFVLKNFSSICHAFPLFEKDIFELAVGSSENAYCCTVTLDKYEQQTASVSEKELTRMVVSVMRSGSLSHNEKVRWLSKFKQEYPQLYYGKFSFLEERFSKARVFSV